MEIQPLLMSGAFAWKILFPSEVNIYCKSTVCSGAESGARILQETVYARAVLGANSKFPEAEYEELVLRVGYSDLLVQPSVGEGVTQTIPGFLCSGCDRGLGEGWETAAGCSPSAQSWTGGSEPSEGGKCFWK